MGKSTEQHVLRLPRPKEQNQGRKYLCRICFAEGIIRKFDSMAALNGHIRMAHKSSPKKKEESGTD